MPGIGKTQLPGAQREDSHPAGDEKAGIVSLAELVVHDFKDFGRTFALHGHVLEQGLGDDHEQRRGHALAAHVAHHHGKVVAIHHEEVVKVASHFLGRVHAGKQLQLRVVRVGGKDARQHVRLYLRCHVQLRGKALLFGGGVCQFFYILVHVHAHFLHGTGQHGKFVLPLDAGEAVGRDAASVLGKVGCLVGDEPDGAHNPDKQDTDEQGDKPQRDERGRERGGRAVLLLELLDFAHGLDHAHDGHDAPRAVGDGYGRCYVTAGCIVREADIRLAVNHHFF